jgi:hypothetical protein
LSRLSRERWALVLRALVEGNPIWVPCRMAGTAKGTVMTLLEAAGVTRPKWTVADVVGLIESHRRQFKLTHYPALGCLLHPALNWLLDSGAQHAKIAKSGFMGLGGAGMPKEPVQILTPLSPEDCRARLQRRIRSWSAPRTWVARRRERPVTGKVSLAGFSIAKYGGLPAYAFKPRAVGSFQPTGQGTLVAVRTPRRVRPFILLGVLSWGLTLALCLTTGYGYLVWESYTHMPPEVLAYQLASGTIVPALVCLFWLHRGRKERQLLLDFLRVTLSS